jgi:membrane protein required for colicin V production
MISTTINYVDVGVVVVLLFFIGIGIARGFTNDFFGLLSWVGAFFATTKLLPYGEAISRKFIHTIFIAQLVAGFVIFLISLIVLVALVKSLAYLVHNSILSGIDRSLGILSGFFRATVLLTVAFMVALMFWKPGDTPQMLMDSRFKPFFLATSRLAAQYFIPQEFMPKTLKQHLYGKESQEQERTTDEIVRALSSPKPQQNEQQRQTEEGKSIKIEDQNEKAQPGD